MADAEFVREMQESNLRLTWLLLRLNELRRTTLHAADRKLLAQLDKDLEESQIGANSADWTK